MNNLKAFRQEHGLSQSQVAALLSVHVHTVKNWENNRANMPQMAWELLKLKVTQSA